MSKSADYFDRIEQRNHEMRAPGDTDYNADDVAEKTPYEQFRLTEEEAEDAAAEILQSNWDDRFDEPWDALYYDLRKENAGTDLQPDGPTIR